VQYMDQEVPGWFWEHPGSSMLPPAQLPIVTTAVSESSMPPASDCTLSCDPKTSPIPTTIPLPIPTMLALPASIIRTSKDEKRKKKKKKQKNKKEKKKKRKRSLLDESQTAPANTPTIVAPVLPSASPTVDHRARKRQKLLVKANRMTYLLNASTLSLEESVELDLMLDPEDEKSQTTSSNGDTYNDQGECSVEHTRWKGDMNNVFLSLLRRSHYQHQQPQRTKPLHLVYLDGKQLGTTHVLRGKERGQTSFGTFSNSGHPILKGGFERGLYTSDGGSEGGLPPSEGSLPPSEGSLPPLLYVANDSPETVEAIESSGLVDHVSQKPINDALEDEWKDVPFAGAYIDLCTGTVKTLLATLERLFTKSRPIVCPFVLGYTLTARDPHGQPMDVRVLAIRKWLHARATCSADNHVNSGRTYRVQEAEMLLPEMDADQWSHQGTRTRFVVMS
jgi:hypothetical protein